MQILLTYNLTHSDTEDFARGQNIRHSTKPKINDETGVES